MWSFILGLCCTLLVLGAVGLNLAIDESDEVMVEYPPPFILYIVESLSVFTCGDRFWLAEQTNNLWLSHP